MNILYYLREFPKVSNSFILNEITELTERGHNVAVFALSRSTPPVYHEEYHELEVPITYLDDVRPRDLVDPGLVGTLDRELVSDMRAIDGVGRRFVTTYRIERCIESILDLPFDIDLIHTHFAIPATLPVKHVADRVGVPWTVTTHAFDLYREPNGSVIRRILSSADAVITVSEYNRRHIRRHLGVTASIEVIHAGIRPEKFRTHGTSQPYRLLTTARLVEKKGVKYAIEATSQLRDTVPNLEYHIVGEGPRREELEQIITNHHLEDTVRMLGHVDDDRLRRELSEAAVFVLPCTVADSGDRDGIPVSLMEAMATTTPPVSTRVSGIPELIDHDVSGILVEDRDPGALAVAIRGLLESPDKRRELGEAAKATVEREFDITNEVAKLERTFQELTDG